MRSRSNGGIIGAYALPTQNYANGVFFIHDAAIYNTGNNPIWPLATGIITSASGGTITTAVDNANYKLHTFTANGTFTVTSGSGFVDILLVGGGGSGGSVYSSSYTGSRTVGGGGAGGSILLATGILVQSGTSFDVQVGQGGSSIPVGTVPSAASHSGKPSVITSSTGYTFTSPGGGYGTSVSSGTQYTSSNGGGAASIGLYGTSDASTGPRASGIGSGLTSSPYGGSSYRISIAGYSVGGGGGGAGYANGYSASYATDASLAACGGDGYQWSRTGYYYGAGGAAGYHTELFSNGSRHTGKYYNNTITYNNGVAGDTNPPIYSDGSSANTNYGNGYGVGGCGASINFLNGVASAGGGSGTSGTVIFCYRYK